MNHKLVRFTFAQWVGYTSLGWCVGFFVVMGIGAISEALHVGNQFALAGVSIGVGYFQAKLVARSSTYARLWFWTTVIGLFVPFIFYDAQVPVLREIREEQFPLLTLMGGLLIGVGQYYFIFRKMNTHAISWILYSALGWSLVHFLLMSIEINSITQQEIPVVLKVIFALIIIFSGGPILGLITGRKITNLFNQS